MSLNPSNINNSLLGLSSMNDLFFLADKGDSEAQYVLGKRFYCGVVPDFVNAVKYFMLSADQGNANAQYDLAECYSYGRGVFQDKKKAIELWNLAANNGHLEAQISLDLEKEKDSSEKSTSNIAFPSFNLPTRNVDNEPSFTTPNQIVGLTSNQNDSRISDLRDQKINQCFIHIQDNHTLEAKRLIIKSNHGDADAQYLLSECYEQGNGVEVDCEKRFALLNLSAKQGHPKAQFRLGEILIIRDLDETIKLWSLSANQGNADAQFNLGLIYYNGPIALRNFKEALRLWTLSANQGNTGAQFYIGRCYLKGEGVKKNIEKAGEFLRLYSKNNNKVSEFTVPIHDILKEVGLCYLKGEGVEQNFQKAIEFLTYSVNSVFGKPESREISFRLQEARYRLGLCYIQGEGVEQNFEEAVKLLTFSSTDLFCNRWIPKNVTETLKYAKEQLALSRNERADTHFANPNHEVVDLLNKPAEEEISPIQQQNSLRGNSHCKTGFEFYKLFRAGPPRDKENRKNLLKAVEQWKLSASVGNAEALNMLGECALKREGVRQHFKVAVDYFTKSANLGNADAQYNLAYCYFEGKGVKKDDNKGLELLNLSVNQGNAKAQYKLGLRLMRKKEIHERIRLWTLSANQGNADAQFRLGQCYLKGEGVEQNFEKAVEFLTLRSNYNEPLHTYEFKESRNLLQLAQYKLGLCYLKGEGVEQNFEKAVEFLTLASTNVNGGNRPIPKNVTETLQYAKDQLALSLNERAETHFANPNHEVVDLLNKPAEEEVSPIQQQNSLRGNSHCKTGFEFYKLFCTGPPGDKGNRKHLFKAVEKWKLSASVGNAEALNMLGECALKGEGVRRSFKTAVEYFTMSANLGNSDAQYNLADCYLRGSGVKTDDNKSFELLNLSVNQGNAKAQYKLGLMYIFGKHPNINEGVRLWKLSANQGNAEAQYQLGSLYGNGWIVAKDTQEAIRLWTLAAHQGQKNALMRLGISLNDQPAIPQNFTKTLEYPKNKLVELQNDNTTVTFAEEENQKIAISEPTINPAICDFDEAIELLFSSEDSPEQHLEMGDTPDSYSSPGLLVDDDLDFLNALDDFDQLEEPTNISPEPMEPSLNDNSSESSIHSESPNRSSEERAPEIILKRGCNSLPIIASKYFLEKKLPERPLIGEVSLNSTIALEKRVELTQLSSISKSNSKIHCHELTSEILVANYYSVDSDFGSAIRNYSRFVFVRAGRKENAFIPQEIEGGKVVLICSPEEEEALKSYVGKNRDLLVVKNIPFYDTIDGIGNYQGLPTTRMLGALAFAWDYYIDNMMIIDDNIKAFYAKQEHFQEECSWKDIYGMYQNSVQQGDLACLSIQTHKPTDKNQLTPKTIIKEGTCGYKSFFIDIEKIKLIMNDPICLLPLHPKLFAEDIFFQFILKEMGLKIASFSKKTMVIQRSRAFTNTCVNVVSSPEAWFDFNVHGVSEAYVKAVESMKEMYLVSQKHYESRANTIKGLDLPKVSSELRKRNQEQSGIFSKESGISDEIVNPRKKRKTKLKSLESAKISNVNVLVEQFFVEFFNGIIENVANENLRAPQKAALLNFSEVVKKNRFMTGYFKMATGIGKTITYSAIVDATRKCPSYQKHNLIITPGIQAANQVYGVLARLEESEGIKTVACINSSYVGQKLVELNEKVNNGSGQTFVVTEESAKILFGNNPELINRFGLIMIDEFHDVSKDLLKFTSLYAKDKGGYVLGFSGTTTKSTVKFFEKRIFDYSTLKAYKDGFLTPWVVDEIHGIKENLNDLPAILKKHVHPHGGILSENQGIIRVEKNEKEKAIDVVKRVVKTLNESGISAAAYYWKLTEAERNQILLKFHNKEVKVIVAHKMLEKAYDGFVDYTMIFKEKIGKNSFTQCRGRVIRPDGNPDKIAYMIVPEGVNLKEEAYLPSEEFLSRLHPLYNRSKKVYKIDAETSESSLSISSQVSNRPAEVITQKSICRLPLKKGTSKQRAALIADFISNPINFDLVKKYLGKYFEFVIKKDQESVKKLFNAIRARGDINLENLCAKIPNQDPGMQIYTFNSEKKQYEFSNTKSGKESSGILYDRENGEYEILIPIKLAKFFAQS